MVYWALKISFLPSRRAAIYVRLCGHGPLPLHLYSPLQRRRSRPCGPASVAWQRYSGPGFSVIMPSSSPSSSLSSSSSSSFSSLSLCNKVLSYLILPYLLLLLLLLLRRSMQTCPQTSSLMVLMKLVVGSRSSLELQSFSACVDVLGPVLFCSVQCCFTSTEIIGTIGDGKPRTATSTFTQLLSSAPTPTPTPPPFPSNLSSVVLSQV